MSYSNYPQMDYLSSLCHNKILQTAWLTQGNLFSQFRRLEVQPQGGNGFGSK